MSFLVVISSAKTMTDKAKKKFASFSQPEFLNEAKKINHSLRELNATQIESLMQINPQLARLNLDRIHNWHTNTNQNNALQAIFSYTGEVYRGVSVQSYTDQDLQYAQDHLRILSGLYGIVRPLDLILPYRLDMGTSFSVEKHKNIYAVWRNKVTTSLEKHMKEKKINTLINLASNEYFSILDTSKLSCKVITPVFYELSGDQLKTIVVYVKKARGLMTSFIMKNRIEDPDDLKNFNEAGYSFYPEVSDDSKWVFVR